MENYMSNLFNFADLSDLPQNLREKLETSTLDNAKKYADVVKAGAAAGFKSLSIRQIEAVATRAAKAGELGFVAGSEIPTTTTVRNYLNEAVKLKLIGKPTRNSYSADTSVVVEGDDDDEVDAPVAATTVDPAVADDPLAGL
jgi:hypothetical protein